MSFISGLCACEQPGGLRVGQVGVAELAVELAGRWCVNFRSYHSMPSS
jgi:hypothetical protein